MLYVIEPTRSDTYLRVKDYFFNKKNEYIHNTIIIYMCYDYIVPEIEQYVLTLLTLSGQLTQPIRFWTIVDNNIAKLLQ